MPGKAQGHDQPFALLGKHHLGVGLVLYPVGPDFLDPVQNFVGVVGAKVGKD